MNYYKDGIFLRDLDYSERYLTYANVFVKTLWGVNTKDTMAVHDTYTALSVF